MSQGALSNYIATIDWGDGIRTVGIVAFEEETGSFEIRADHAYLKDGIYTIYVLVDAGDRNIVLSTSATITVDDAGFLSSDGFDVSAVADEPTGNVALGVVRSYVVSNIAQSLEGDGQLVRQRTLTHIARIL